MQNISSNNKGDMAEMLLLDQEYQLPTGDKPGERGIGNIKSIKNNFSFQDKAIGFLARQMVFLLDHSAMLLSPVGSVPPFDWLTPRFFSASQ
jgi:hypothetical protein